MFDCSTIASAYLTLCRRQMYHKDGPTMFDPRQFDSNGNILVDAPAQANRTAVLPLGVARSGLQAFFSRTFLGLRPKDDFDPTHGLRLYSSIGRTIIFNMDVDHQGWLTTDQQTRPSSDEELSVHVRGHFYMYSRDLRYLPTSDLEESFEVMSCVAHGELDAAKKMVILDALSTFVDEPEVVDRAYESMRNQAELDRHCSTNGFDTYN